MVTHKLAGRHQVSPVATLSNALPITKILDSSIQSTLHLLFKNGDDSSKTAVLKLLSVSDSAEGLTKT